MGNSVEKPFTLKRQLTNTSKTMKEADIQSLILQYLSFARYDHWRSFVGGIPQKNGKFYSKNPMAGHPDITGFLRKKPHQMFCIEVKSAKGVLSKEQKIWIKMLNRHNVPVIIARSLQQTIDALKEMEEDGVGRYL